MGIQINRKTSALTLTGTNTALWGHRNGQVKAINKTNIVKIPSIVWCYRELYKRGRWTSSNTVTLDLAGATVCRGTIELAERVCSATSTSLEPAAPWWQGG
ncbi:hypothetical protein JCGZ_08558 [Jatropha curcas]|uniref:Uncharacterized protein n=1 Tax=Jatropha curcas TaxID=180498 RepID=A0A067KL38_JATCU|nr:hypothetical protein JCGZ_08558 [Jatropha curcas]